MRMAVKVLVARLVAIALVLLAAPLSLEARAGEAYRIGSSPCRPLQTFQRVSRCSATASVFWDTEEGKNISIEYRRAEGRDDRLPALAAELVRLKVDVIVTVATPPAKAAQRATDRIPIVFVAVADPIGVGLVANLARPGSWSSQTQCWARGTGRLRSLHWHSSIASPRWRGIGASSRPVA